MKSVVICGGSVTGGRVDVAVVITVLITGVGLTTVVTTVETTGGRGTVWIIVFGGGEGAVFVTPVVTVTVLYTGTVSVMTEEMKRVTAA